ncbi:hypothetical protein KB553_07870 [Chryseobacterium rhizoplanae]|uniref:hypothetical protein n=1 Tax=Chryseobacterium rhizoplanae TaxID=1609531 RepID=UPI001CE37682|nr:hypothetical protein [Chryseobacterium rhizoplanae]UCA61442.1 hypothetical protein KB553_07870 [Chryseobacterium rhizoplanae]
MKSTDFINGIYKECVTNQLELYKHLLENTPNATDPTWIETIKIYKSLTNEEKKSILQFFKIVEVNTIASMLAIIDGDKAIYDDFISFSLIPENSENISGNLTNEFLQRDEMID